MHRWMSLSRHVLTLWAGATIGFVTTQSAAGASPEPAAPGGNAVHGRAIGDWLLRTHDASRKRTYVGTFVVSTASGGMASARIWHACEGGQQVEHIESLSGTPRSTFRSDDEVITFLPESKVVRIERRDSLGSFPEPFKTHVTALPQFYSARKLGNDRVAGFDTEVVHIQPKDSLRFGYRVWSEKESGLVVKLQTLDTEGRVLEQAAFSELQLGVPVSIGKLLRMMNRTDGYVVKRPELLKIMPLNEGWMLKNPVPGFKSMNSYRRSMPGGDSRDVTLQWIFSDGLASVSLFVEPYDSPRHGAEGQMALGATQTLTRRLGGAGDGKSGGGWWLTVVGEVPPQTLAAFAQALERRK